MWYMLDVRSGYTGLLTPVLESNGIECPAPPRYTPEVNGIAEWSNCTIQETFKAFLFQVNMPFYFWSDAVTTALVGILRDG
jgi:hypothetical protein